MKKSLVLLLTLLLLGSLTACGGQDAAESPAPEESVPPTQSPAPQEVAPVDGEQHILIAYFTRLDNTEADLDAMIQGGGPYGPLGETLADADVDAVTSASITLLDGQVYGNTEAVARMIQETVGGELFSIQTVEPYPVDYDTLIDQGGAEKSAAARPALSSQVEDMERYDTVFLGFPNWWYDMPMPVYHFLESYDFAGKTVIPFATSASSGFSDTLRIMTEMLPDAQVSQEGLHIPMREVTAARPVVSAWLEELGLPQATQDQAQEETAMQMTVAYDGNTITFELNDSQAAQDLYGQLPLTVEMENFSTNEKIFYPPDALDTSDAPQASGGAGTLAYYAPWGDVVLFYGAFGGNSSLYGLGQAVEGMEWIGELSGTVTFQKGGDQ